MTRRLAWRRSIEGTPISPTLSDSSVVTRARKDGETEKCSRTLLNENRPSQYNVPGSTVINLSTGSVIRTENSRKGRGDLPRHHGRVVFPVEPSSGLGSLQINGVRTACLVLGRRPSGSRRYPPAPWPGYAALTAETDDPSGVMARSPEVLGRLGAAAGLAFAIGLGQPRLIGRAVVAGFAGAVLGLSCLRPDRGIRVSTREDRLRYLAHLGEPAVRPVDGQRSDGRRRGPAAARALPRHGRVARTVGPDDDSRGVSTDDLPSPGKGLGVRTTTTRDRGQPRSIAQSSVFIDPIQLVGLEILRTSRPCPTAR